MRAAAFGDAIAACLLTTWHASPTKQATACIVVSVDDDK
jgi:hypothetical protein